MLVDVHCHLNSLSKIIREEVIASSSNNYYFVDSSIDLNSAKASIEISNQHNFVYSSLGFHPFSGKEFLASTINEYIKMVEENEKVIAIGEIGLDFKAPIPSQVQEDILSDFIRLAKSKELPVILHNRWEDAKMLDVLDKFYSNYEKVIFHCFSYDKKFLEKIIERGGFASFSLNILRNKEDIISSLKACPLNRVLLETDSPYMRVKGTPSTPTDINKTYLRAAEIKEVSEKELAEAVFSNIKGLFPKIRE